MSSPFTRTLEAVHKVLPRDVWVESSQVVPQCRGFSASQPTPL